MATQILGKVGMVLKGEYNNATNYQKLDVVIYNGQSYVAKENTTGNLPTNTTYWQLLAEKGYTPIKGTDYWTNADKAEIEDDAVSQVESDIQSTLDSIEDTANTANTNSQTAINTANRAESIAKGRATGYVFDTVADLDLWLQNSDNVEKLVLGDNLYIRAVGVPDYWWDGTEKQQLETQKVDLSEYEKITNHNQDIQSLQSQINNKANSSDVNIALGNKVDKSSFVYDSTTETLSITIS